MLLKDLKNIIFEDDTQPAVSTDVKPTDAGTNKPTSTAPTNKPQRITDKIKSSSDGIGKESYKVSSQLGVNLQKTLTNELNVKEVKVANNIVTVIFNFSNNPGKFIVRQTNQEISQEDVTNHITTIIMSSLGSQANNYNIAPSYLGGILTFAIKSKLEKTSD